MGFHYEGDDLEVLKAKYTGSVINTNEILPAPLLPQNTTTNNDNNIPLAPSVPHNITCHPQPHRNHKMVQVNLDMTDSMGTGKLVRHMENPSYTYDKYLICMGLGPSILSVIDESPSYSGPSYPSSPVPPTMLRNPAPPLYSKHHF